MQIQSAAAIPGLTATVSSTAAFVPQITKIWKTGGKDVSFSMLWLYVTGVTLWLCYGLSIGATALSVANAASIVFAGTCLVLKLMKETPTPIRFNKKRLRIAIDMDETIADSLKEQIRRYNTEFAANVSPDDLYGKNLEEFVLIDRREAVRLAVRDESFFQSPAVIDGAQEAIRELAREHEVFIVSAAMEVPVSFAAKHRWLRKHFPFIPDRNVVFCGDKGIIDADYLIDDDSRHFVNFRGTGILFSAPHNRSEMGHVRFDNWREICREFIVPCNSPEFDGARPEVVHE